MKNHIIAATFAVSALGANASDTFQEETIAPNDPRVIATCEKFQNKTGMLLDGREVCEYSTDNGKSWKTTTGIALGVAALLSLGTVGIIRLRRRKGDWQMAKRDTTISDAQREAREKNELQTAYTVFDPNKQDPRLARVTEFIESKKFKPAEVQLDMILRTYPNRTDLYIKKLELFFTKGDTEQYQEIYTFITNTVDPLKELIPVEIYNLIRDWGKEIDPLNALYEKNGNHEENVMQEWIYIDAQKGVDQLTPLLGTQFYSEYRGGETLSLGYSDGGVDHMQDYVNTIETSEKIIMIVLDGVGSGEKGTTEQFVQQIGYNLETLSLEEILADKILTSNFPFNVGSTAGKATIENNTLTVEKVGDTGIVVFDKAGNIILQDIGGGYIPDSWYGSNNMVDLVEGQDIVNEIRTNGFSDVPPFMEDMTKGEFTRTYGRYTKQIGANSRNETVVKHKHTLQEDDVVVIATDGVFDNISIEDIIEIVKSEHGAMQSVQAIITKLNALAENDENSFGGNYKKDNIGLTIYRHVNKGTTSEVIGDITGHTILATEFGATEDGDGPIEIVVDPAEVEVLLAAPNEEIIKSALDMGVVAEKLTGNTLTVDAIDALKSAIPKDSIYKRIALRQKSVATKYGFDISEDQNGGIKLSASRPESIIYYLNNDGGIEQNTEFELTNVISLSVIEDGYMEAVIAPTYETIKILLTKSDSE